jgi:hypothetical protein
MNKYSHTASTWEQLANEVCGHMVDWYTGFGDFCFWKTEEIIRLVQLYWLYRINGETREDLVRYTIAVNEIVDAFRERNDSRDADTLFKILEEAVGGVYAETPVLVRKALEIPSTVRE